MSKFLQKEEACLSGHLSQRRKNLQSTKLKSSSISVSPQLPTESSLSPTILTPSSPAEPTTCKIYYKTHTSTMFQDLCGKFPIRSSRNNKHIMVFYHCDTNAIIIHACESRSDNDTAPIFEKAISHLRNNYLKATFITMDDEASKSVQSTISNKKMRFQLVPPNNHRANAAERAIQTFKHHFISCLSTCDKNFPLHLWCRLLL